MKPSINVVLHAHIPWVKRAGRWPFGEEWLFQAMLGTYIPLLDMLERLSSFRVRGAITLGITPVLIEMLRDRYLMGEFDTYLNSRLALLEGDLARFSDDDPLQKLAYGARSTILAFQERWSTTYERDLILPITSLAQRHEIEIVTSAATHAYLPMLESEAAVEAQIATGIATTVDAFGVTPAGIWLPECAYDPRLVPLLERFGLRYFFADERVLALDVAPSRPFRVPDSKLAYFLRDPLARGEVMDSDLGYPGTEWCREFYKRDSYSGMRYWRVTSRTATLDEKLPYDPDRALAAVDAQASDFAQKVALRGAGGQSPYLVLTFDAELFGHWWGEGIAWLEQALLKIQQEGVADFVLPSAYLDAHPASEAHTLPRCSWGVGADDRTWDNPKTSAYWETVRDAQHRFEDLARRYGPGAPFVAQAARELFLLQSSDWPFLLTMGDAGDYPAERISTHATRFAACAAAAAGAPFDPTVLSGAEHADTAFRNLKIDASARAADLA